jgi:hypothetical protein
VGLSPRSLGFRGTPERVTRELEGIDEHISAVALGGQTHSGMFEIRRRVQPPAAASMAVIGASEEEDVSHEDLSVLSAKLKRILDEEARRHGIDV